MNLYAAGDDRILTMPLPRVPLSAIAEKLTHKIPNPLSVIITAASRMEERQNPLFREEESFVPAILAAAERIEEILDHFMLYACPEPPCIDRIDLNELCRLAIQTSRIQELSDPIVPLILKKDENLPEIMGDPDRMRTILENLMTVFARILKTPGAATLRLGHDDCSVSITLEHGGAGISHEFVKKAYRPFAPVPHGTIGLEPAIAARLIAAHNGTVDASLFGNEASGITVTLPRHEITGE